MSKLSVGRLVAALVMSVGVGLVPGSCKIIYIDGNCAENADCHTIWNYWGLGTICAAGRCRCLNPTERSCCADNAETCTNEYFDCRPAAECATCESDDDCPGPPDPRCGVARCVNTKCELEIWGGEATASQRAGDCKRTICTFSGTAEVVSDPSDAPLDANPCTSDSCEGSEPSNAPYSDKTPCPGMDLGICVAGKCRACSEAIDSTVCPDGYKCAFELCVPSECFDLQMNGQETFTDCGGPDCAPCAIGMSCVKGEDCKSGVCADQICQASTHDDKVKNDSETGVDCGYPEAPPNSCPDGEGCVFANDCQSAVCYLGVCQAPTCTDAVKNGSETDTDCGGSCSPCQD